MTCDARRLEQVNDDAAVYAQLVVVAQEHRFAFQIIEMLYLVEAMRNTGVQVERNVIVVFFVS